jgi:hypothetical protein
MRHTVSELRFEKEIKEGRRERRRVPIPPVRRLSKSTSRPPRASRACAAPSPDEEKGLDNSS